MKILSEPHDDIIARLANAGEDTSDGNIEPTVEPVLEAGDESLDPPALLAGKYKEVSQLEEAYKNAEAKMHEESRKRAEYEQRLADLQAEPSAPIIPLNSQPTTMEELQQLAFDNPSAAVEFAALNAPHTMPTVLATVRGYDAVHAEELSEWYHDYKMDQRLASVQQPMLQQQASNAAAAAHAEVSRLPGYEALKPAIAEVVKARPHWFQSQDPAQLAAALRDAYEIAKSQSGAVVANAQAQVDATRGGVAHAETGGSSATTGGANFEPDLTPEQEIANSIISASKAGKW